MQNVNDMEMFWQQWSEAQIHVYTEFPEGNTDTGMKNISPDGFHPHHLQRAELLLPDHINDVRFCEWLQPWLHTVHERGSIYLG
jgi:hypothetical protein